MIASPTPQRGRSVTDDADRPETAGEAAGREARMELLRRNRRSAVPLRKSFVQAARGRTSRQGPLREFVRTGDLRALRAYLVVVGACGNGDRGWSTEHDSAVWARLMDIHLHATAQAARTGAGRTLRRLEEHRLITCRRPRGSSRIAVTLLREDGSGVAYERPRGETEADRYLQIPTAFWARGFDERIDLPGLALLLTVAREKPWSAFPAEKAPEWYGWSADTHLRGLQKLRELELVEHREEYRKTPLSPTGFTVAHQYRLVPWMEPGEVGNGAGPTAESSRTPVTGSGR